MHASTADCTHCSRALMARKGVLAMLLVLAVVLAVLVGLLVSNETEANTGAADATLPAPAVQQPVAAVASAPAITLDPALPTDKFLVHSAAGDCDYTRQAQGFLGYVEDEMACVTEADAWRQLCTQADKDVVGPDFFLYVARENPAFSTDHELEALESVARNRGGKILRFYWDAADQRKPCKAVVEFAGMYQGTTINQEITSAIGNFLVVNGVIASVALSYE